MASIILVTIRFPSSRSLDESWDSKDRRTTASKVFSDQKHLDFTISSRAKLQDDNSCHLMMQQDDSFERGLKGLRDSLQKLLLEKDETIERLQKEHEQRGRRLEDLQSKINRTDVEYQRTLKQNKALEESLTRLRLFHKSIIESFREDEIKQIKPLRPSSRSPQAVHSQMSHQMRSPNGFDGQTGRKSFLKKAEENLSPENFQRFSELNDKYQKGQLSQTEFLRESGSILSQAPSLAEDFNNFIQKKQ